MIRTKRLILAALILILILTTAFLGLRLPVSEPPGTLPPPTLEIPRLLSGHDANNNGSDDLADIVAGARAEADRQTAYQDGYYAGGYPPATIGVCTDVIWRALSSAGYDLKALVDEDIRHSPAAYPRVDGRPDPNIDFRRVANLIPFFDKYAQALPTEVIPGDTDNLAQWQGGDIVIFDRPLAHIGIVSDRRRPDGVPLLLHNGGPYASEEDRLLTWPTPITHHFRFPAGE